MRRSIKYVIVKERKRKRSFGTSANRFKVMQGKRFLKFLSN